MSRVMGRRRVVQDDSGDIGVILCVVNIRSLYRAREHTIKRENVYRGDATLTSFYLPYKQQTDRLHGVSVERAITAATICNNNTV